MADIADLPATIDGLKKMLAENLGPELDRQDAALKLLIKQATVARTAIGSLATDAEAEANQRFEDCAASLVLVEAKLDEMSGALEPAQTAIDEFFLGHNDTITKSVEKAESALAINVSALKAGRIAFEDKSETFKSQLKQIQAQLDAAAMQVMASFDLADSKLNESIPPIDLAAQTLNDWLSKLGDAIETGLGRLETETNAEIDKISEAIKTLIRQCQDAIDEFSKNATTVLGQLSAVANTLSELFGKDVKQILSQVQELLDLVDEILPLLKAVKQWI